MAGVWVNVGFKLAGLRECSSDSSGDTREVWISGRDTGPSTIDTIFVTSQDESRSSVRGGGRSTIAKGEDLSKSHRLLGALSKESSTNVEVARV